MAEILVNGGVKIIPKGRPPVVETYHRLKLIEKNILIFRRKFEKADKEDISQVYPLTDRSQKLMYSYSCTLEVCANDIKATGARQEFSDYYSLLKIFISRASDAHTVLPYARYLTWYRDLKDGDILLGKKFKWHGYPFKDYGEMASFISRRIDESLSVCRAYLCLLSSTMDSGPRHIELGGLASEILAVQTKVYHDKCDGAMGSSKIANRQWIEEKLSGISFSSKFSGKIQGFEPLVYFLMEHIITNSLKATLLAAANQHAKKDFFRFSKTFAGVPVIAEPRISVEITDGGNGNVVATFTDNGLGIPKESLKNLFSPDNFCSFFSSFIHSNGSSLKLFPYIMDLTGINLHVESEVGQGTRFTLTIPKETAFN